AQTTKRHLTLLAQVVRSTTLTPRVRTDAQESGLGRDLDVPVRVERLADQLLGDVGPVGVGGVDEVDAEFHGAAQDRATLVGILRRSPNPFSGNAHRAEAKTIHRLTRVGEGGRFSHRTSFTKCHSRVSTQKAATRRWPLRESGLITCWAVACSAGSPSPCGIPWGTSPSRRRHSRRGRFLCG